MQHDWIFSKCQYKPNIFGGSREILVWVLHPHTVLEIYTAKKQRLNDGDRDYRINPRAGTTRLKMTLRFAPFLLPGRRFLRWHLRWEQSLMIWIICFLIHNLGYCRCLLGRGKTSSKGSCWQILIETVDLKANLLSPLTALVGSPRLHERRRRRKGDEKCLLVTRLLLEAVSRD